ncbi:MAG: hypothetical protein ACE5K4_02865 [Candidatus Hydrothermarchaeota archaeon]
MSLEVFRKFLREIGVYRLNMREEEHLFRDVIRCFGVIGSNECDHLEKMLEDPYYREAIKKFVLGAIRLLKEVDREEERGEKMRIYV